MNSLRTRITNRNIKSIIRQLQTLSTSTSEKPAVSEIKIPKRIDRGPTDILKALEGTLLTDSTANDYRFMDDPFFNPTSNSRKRTYALSKESGRRAARFIIENHSDIMYSEISEPLIKSYLPPPVYTEKSQVNEEILRNLITKACIKDALNVYTLLEKNVGLETKQALLELLCFYNSEEQEISEDFPEELRYRAHVKINRNVWNNSSEIKELFEELKNDPKTVSAAYSAMICGTAKYFAIKQSHDLYKECMEKDIPVSVTAYNFLIQLTPSIKRDNEQRVSRIQSYLQDMLANGVNFNTRTLNALLSALERRPENIDYVTTMLTKFKSLGIKPSLATYYYLLSIFSHKDDKIDQNVFMEILKEVNNNEFVLEDVMDQHFFSKAMYLASNNYFPSETSHQIYSLLLDKGEREFLGKQAEMNNFYNDYLKINLSNESPVDFLKFYNKFVPAVFIPNVDSMRHIMEVFAFARKDYNLLQLLKTYTNHIVSFEMLYNNNLLRFSLKAITRHYSPSAEASTRTQMTDYVWKVWTHLKTLNQRVKYKVQLPAEVYGHIIFLLMQGSDLEKVREVLTFFVTNQDKIIGSLKRGHFEEIFRTSIEKMLVHEALLLVDYAKEYEIGKMKIWIDIANLHLRLNEDQKAQLLKLAE